MRKSVLFILAAALALAPAAAQQVRTLDPRDVAQGQRENTQFIEQLGGAETGPRAAYVQAVGQRVASYSGIAAPGQALHFTTLNSAVENAFSVPGGYVYITRQLMALMGNDLSLPSLLVMKSATSRQIMRISARRLSASLPAKPCPMS